jgi:hypothetical protein
MDWEKFIVQVSEGVKGLCVGSLGNYKNALAKDMQRFLEKSKHYFEQWTQQVLEGKLTKEDFEMLVNRQMAGAEFITIKQTGMAKIELDKLSSSIIKTVIDIVFRLLP